MTNILIVVWLHFIGDFVLQSDWVAINKSKRNDVLAMHVLIYAMPLLWFGWRFALLNAALHFLTDWPTSRATSKLWQAGKRHWFFVVIGLDQAIHLTCLLVTLP